MQVVEFQFASFNMKSCVLRGHRKFALSKHVFFTRGEMHGVGYMLYLFFTWEEFILPHLLCCLCNTSPKVVVSWAHSLNCSYLTHIGLQTPRKPLVSSAGLSRIPDCLGAFRRCWPGLAAWHPTASPSSFGGFICSMPVPTATRSGFMSDFSKDSNGTRIQHCFSFSGQLEDINK